MKKYRDDITSIAENASRIEAGLRAALLPLSLFAFSLACSSGGAAPPSGRENEPCYADATCESGLCCVYSVCKKQAAASCPKLGETGYCKPSMCAQKPATECFEDDMYGYVCGCEGGYSWNPAAERCELNERTLCSPSPCGLYGTCKRENGTCGCFERYGGSNCDMCAEGYIGYPYCVPVSTDEKGFKWARAPGGTFKMGCGEEDDGCDASEKPAHEVTLKAFMINPTEITQKAYKELTGENPSQFFDCPDCPVERVSWAEAGAFCEKIGGRLPTEAEFEFALRAGTTTLYYCWEKEKNCPDAAAWHSSNSGSKTHAAGGKIPNAYGLYDMMGNVFEWTADCYRPTYEGAPSDGSAVEDDACEKRVLRGGAYSFNLYSLRSSARFYGSPQEKTGRNGFRCVKNAD